MAFGQKKNEKGITSWDRNKDGFIQQNEIPQELRPQVKAWAKKLELNPEKPLPLDKLVKNKASEKPKKLSPKEKADLKAGRKESRAEGKSSDAVTSVKKTRRRVAGFGNDVGHEDEDEVAEAAKSKKTESKDGKPSAVDRRKQRHFQMLARSLMFQNDKNKSGRLERSEWAKLSGNPGASDANQDGVLTSEELAVHLQGYGSRDRDVTRRTAARSSRAKKAKSGKSYRFLTPHERLPAGLPSWFTAQDENLDGQISLVEFEPQQLTRAKVAKFRQLDLNRDGFIVANEFLRATQVD